MYQIRYPMVFCIKYRHSLLVVEERFAYLKQVFQKIGERYWFEVEEMITDDDPVHVFVGAAPKYAPSRVM
jgi:putative transposase